MVSLHSREMEYRERIVTSLLGNRCPDKHFKLHFLSKPIPAEGKLFSVITPPILAENKKKVNRPKLNEIVNQLEQPLTVEMPVDLPTLLPTLRQQAAATTIKSSSLAGSTFSANGVDDEKRADASLSSSPSSSEAVALNVDGFHIAGDMIGALTSILQEQRFAKEANDASAKSSIYELLALQQKQLQDLRDSQLNLLGGFKMPAVEETTNLKKGTFEIPVPPVHAKPGSGVAVGFESSHPHLTRPSTAPNKPSPFQAAAYKNSTKLAPLASSSSSKSLSSSSLSNPHQSLAVLPFHDTSPMTPFAQSTLPLRSRPGTALPPTSSHSVSNTILSSLTPIRTETDAFGLREHRAEVKMMTENIANVTMTTTMTNRATSPPRFSSQPALTSFPQSATSSSSANASSSISSSTSAFKPVHDATTVGIKNPSSSESSSSVDDEQPNRRVRFVLESKPAGSQFVIDLFFIDFFLFRLLSWCVTC